MNTNVEFDAVTLDDDMNLALNKILNDEHVIENGMTDKHQEEFRLYYVAVTRCRFQLNNANFIEYL